MYYKKIEYGTLVLQCEQMLLMTSNIYSNTKLKFHSSTTAFLQYILVKKLIKS